MVKDLLKGVYAPITTPFLENGEVDYDGLEKNMAFYAKSAIQGYLALGSNGENKSLCDEEKFKALEIIIKNKGAHQRVMTGCIAESTKETIELAKRAEALGTDFITLLSPCYFAKQMTDEVLIKYFSDVADSVSAPCLVYCAPQFSAGIVLSVDLIKEVAKHPNIVGMKDSSSGNIDGYLQCAPDDFAVMAGSANFFIHTLEGGGTGGIVSLANAFPDEAAKVYAAFLEGDKAKYDELNERILLLNKSVSGKGGVAAVKAAMDMAGLVGGNPRLPLFPLAEIIKTEMKNVLTKEGMI